MSCQDIIVKIEGGIIFQGSEATNSPPRIYNENKTSQINNLTNIFTTTFPFISGSEDVKFNGLSQTLIDDYIVTNSTTIQLVSIPTTNDHLSISYNKA